jgi:hypothetical protein
MSDTPGIENVIPQAESENQPIENQPAENPAWSDFLGGFPESMHPMVKERLAKWDEGINSRIQQVHSEYEPWKAFKENGITPDVLQQAYGVFEAINNNPQEVYKILGESFGFANQTPQAQGLQPQIPQQGQLNPQQQTPNQLSGDEYEIGQGGQYNPEVAKLQAMVDNMANIMLTQEKQRQEQYADQVLDSQLKEAHAKHGNFDEKFVLAYVNAGFKMDDAIAVYNNMRNDILTQHNRPSAPVVISGQGTGQLPSQQLDPTKLNKTETRGLVAEMIKATRQQG